MDNTELGFFSFIIISLILLASIFYSGVEDVKSKEKMLSSYIGLKYKNLHVVAYEYPNKLLLNNGEFIDYRIVKK